jgi:hypothetical protein
MTSRSAVLLFRGRTFEAESVEIEGGWVHASGRWRRRTGANFATVDYGERVSRSWPRSAVVEIRWGVS